MQCTGTITMNAVYIGQELLLFTNKKLRNQIFLKQVGTTMCEYSLISGIMHRETKTLSLPVSVSEEEHGPRIVLEQRTIRRRGHPPEILCPMASKSPGR